MAASGGSAGSSCSSRASSHSRTSRIAPLAVEPLRVRGDQSGRGALVAGGHRVPDGLVGLPVLLVPGGGAAADPGLLTGLAPVQLRLEHLGEQPVVAIPLALVVLGNDEQVERLDLVEPGGGAGRVQHRVAERAADAVQHRGPQQEPDRLRRLAGQHLVEEVVHDVAAAAGDLPGGLGRLRLRGDRQPGQVDPRRPPLGVRHDLPDLGGGQVDAELAQQVGGLVRPEREVRRPELQQPTLAAQPAEPHPGPPLAGGGDHPPGRQRRRQIRDDLQCRAAPDRVQVVQHHHAGLDRGQQRRELADRLARPALLRQGQDRGQLVGIPVGPGRGRDVADHRRRVVVRVVELHPVEPPVLDLTPLCERRRLPVPGRRHQQDEPDVPADPGESGQQTPTVARRRVGPGEVGGSRLLPAGWARSLRPSGGWALLRPEASSDPDPLGPRG